MVVNRTRVPSNLTLGHFQQSQRSEKPGDLEDARFEVASAQEYRDMYWYRVESEVRKPSEG